MVDCRTCKARLRADQLPEKNGVKQCPNCGGKDLTEARPFNLMFSTQMGASADPESIAYLRPETAQSIFVQFKNVLDTSRKKLPFGIARRSEGVSERSSIRAILPFPLARVRADGAGVFLPAGAGDGVARILEGRALEILREHRSPLRQTHVLTVPDADRAFYSKELYDIEYEFPFGVQELGGVAYRTDHDLKLAPGVQRKAARLFSMRKRNSVSSARGRAERRRGSDCPRAPVQCV